MLLLPGPRPEISAALRVIAELGRLLFGWLLSKTGAEEECRGEELLCGAEDLLTQVTKEALAKPS